MQKAQSKMWSVLHLIGIRVFGIFANTPVQIKQSQHASGAKLAALSVMVTSHTWNLSTRQIDSVTYQRTTKV